MFDVRYPTPATCPNMDYGWTCSKLSRAIQLGHERKWVTKPRTSWTNVETLENRSKQASCNRRTYVCKYSYYSGDSSEVELHGKFIMQVSMRKDVLLVCQAGI
jgi:hypothetical protein